MNPRLSLIAAMLFSAAVARADWTNVAPGVDYQEFKSDTTDIHVTRIDLTNDAIQVVVSRESERGLKVSEFAKKEKAIVAMNGDYFDEKFSPIGLTIGPCGPWAGSKDTSREGVIAFGEHKASIRRQKEVMDPPETWVAEAISGWPALVLNCEIVKPLPGSAAFTAVAASAHGGRTFTGPPDALFRGGRGAEDRCAGPDARAARGVHA
jgi:uncharacterized protein YigE (DUF2233 family)